MLTLAWVFFHFFFVYRLRFLLTGPVQMNTSANGLRETAKNLFGNHVGSQLLFSDLVSNACSTNKWTLERGCYQTVALRGLWAISLVLHSYLLLNGQLDRFAADTVQKCSHVQLLPIIGHWEQIRHTSYRVLYVAPSRTCLCSRRTGWRSESLTYWPIDWLTGWLVECLWQFECLMKWLAVCLWTTDWLGDRFDMSEMLTGWLTDWNTESGWLFGWLHDWLD